MRLPVGQHSSAISEITRRLMLDSKVLSGFVNSKELFVYLLMLMHRCVYF